MTRRFVFITAAVVCACSSQGGSNAGFEGDAGNDPDATATGNDVGTTDAESVDAGVDSPDVASGDASDANVADAEPPIAGPCDIYANGGTPCVAAHSTVRALYGAFHGSLYQVRRASDKATKDIGVLTAGGIADAAAQDLFCAGTTCTISILYDQSPKGNDLTSAPGGGAAPKADVEADATALRITIAGHAAYAVYVSPGTGYRRDATKGIATGDEPEGEYMVTSGRHYDGSCCFDYGNAETNNLDTGAGHMEAVYFGSAPTHDAGAGPWVMADLENGLFAGATKGSHAANSSMPYDFVTAMVKGEPSHWAVRGANAQSGGLKTIYDGVRPSGYDPMKKEGAIILGIGGDNSNRSAGTFFEGCMTQGYPSTATDDAVQANIVAAGYGR